MMRQPHMPPQTACHHMSNMSQHQQSHMNMSTGQQHNHPIHNYQNCHQHRSGHQHNHHSHQRMNYGQNRPNFHNGNHNMHSNHGPNNVANISTTVSQPQQQQQETNINSKIDTNNQPQQSNSQPKYKTMESTNLANNHLANQQQHTCQKSSIQMTSKSENVLNMEVMDINHGCVDDQGATSNTSSKSKTPMCLINELIRTNQLKHQYRVTDEIGPSHDKMYTVVLELGDERYSAQSKTIKGAQQSAAAAALEKTNYKPAPTVRRVVLPREYRREKYGPVNTLTPTVQLNALAMKRGIPTNYSCTYPKSYNEQTLSSMRNSRTKGNKSRFQHDKFPTYRPPQFIYQTTEDDPFRVTVTIGEKQFSGTGLTLQSAKHDAASKALSELQDDPSKQSQSTVSNNFEAADKHVHFNIDIAGENNVDRSKSAISVVQEIAQKRDLPIRFVVENETGPAHMKHFVIKCSVGEMETTGSGNSKKVAKKHAAENMYNELKKLPPLRSASEMQGNRRKQFVGKRIASSNSRQQVQQTTRRKGSAQVKEVNNTSTSATETTTNDNDRNNNPIQILLHIQQSSQQPEPLFNVVEERGANRRKQFVVEISYAGLTARGTNSNKKLAKREAARSMLGQLGYNEFGKSDVIASQNTNSQNTNSQNTNSQNTNSQNTNSQNTNRKVTFSEARVINENNGQSVGGAAGRQLVPGILLMKSPENNRKAKNSTQSGINNTTTATIAKELLDAGTSLTAVAIIRKSSPVKKTPTEETKPAIELSPSKIEQNNNTIDETKTTTSLGGIRATDQLLYLADLLKFEVQFDDFPRGNHKDYLTLASLNTDPPQMFHGSGNSLEASKNNAALAALKALSELGLDNVNRPRDQQPKSILSNGKSN